MKFLVLTDTHGIFRDIWEKNQPLPEYDIVVVLGDHYRLEMQQLSSYTDKPIYGIFGNHDVFNLYDGLPITNFCGKCINTQPSFIGWEGCHKYKETQEFSFTQVESLQHAMELECADILFSHDGPYGYCRTKDDMRDNAHCGLQGITHYIKKNKPKVCIFGHHHRVNHFQIKTALFKNQYCDCYNVYQMAWFDIDKNGNVKDWKPMNIE